MKHKNIWGAISRLEETQDRHGELILEQRKEQQGDSSALYGRVGCVETKVATLERADKLRREDSEVQGTNLQSQIISMHRLVSYITTEIITEPDMGEVDENVGDTAIRLLGRYREALLRIEKAAGETVAYPPEGYYHSVVSVHRVARAALGIQEKDNG